jgi:hypothetical protein
MGFWSAQAKVECIMLKSAWHWGGDSSVTNNTLGEPDHTPFYEGIPSSWNSVDGDHVISTHFVGGLLD